MDEFSKTLIIIRVRVSTGLLSEIRSSVGEFELLLRLTTEIFDLVPDVLVNPSDFVVFPSSTRLVALLKIP
jgi:hypothetical protein